MSKAERVALSAVIGLAWLAYCVLEEGVTDLRDLGLNDRQIEVLRLMVNEGQEITNAKYQNLFGVSRRTATRDLKKLVETEWVRQEGSGKGTRYSAV